MVWNDWNINLPVSDRRHTYPAEDAANDFESLFGQPLFPSLTSRAECEDKAWAPTVEFIEKADKYIVRMELPGVKKKDIEIKVNGDVLEIRGQKKIDHEIEEEDYHYCERHYGEFFRAIKFPTSVNGEKIEAEFTDGVLQVNLPKMAKESKKISTSTSKKPAGKS